MPDSHTFTGLGVTGYPDYVDLDTETMLFATPGQPYRMRSVGGDLPVPPADGRWVPTQAPAVSVRAPAVPAAPAKSAATPEGGE